MDKKAICAVILGCKPADLMGFKDYGAFVAVLDPAGRKYQFTNEQLAEAERRGGAEGRSEGVLAEGRSGGRSLPKRSPEHPSKPEASPSGAVPAKPAKKIEPKIKKTREKASAGAGSLPKNPDNARKVVGK